MKKIIVGCLGVLVAFHTAVAAGPYYDLRLWASSATLKTAGTITVENSASTGAATITLAGASGVVTATSFAGLASSATYAATAGTASSATYATTSASSTYATTAGSAPMDNLGNHIATTTLQTAYWIDSSSNISAVDFKASGKVGIGLTNPLSPIHIYDGSVSTAIYVTIDKYAGVNTGLYINASNGGAASGDVKGIYITGDNSSGGTNRGIHINSTFMDYALVANGAAPSYFGGPIQSASSITAANFYGTVATAAQPNITSLGDLPLLVVTGTATFPGSGIWNASGNVGIGTTAPTRKLDVQRADDGLAAYALAQGASSATGIEGIATGVGTNVGVLGAANLGTTNTAIGTLAGNPAVGAGNYAINSLSAAQSYFAGPITVNDSITATSFIGAADNLGNHVATTTLSMGAYAVVTSSNMSANAFQISGSTVLATGTGTGSVSVGAQSNNSLGSNFNTMLGYQTGYLGGVGANTYVGYQSGKGSAAGPIINTNNSFLGRGSGLNISGGSQNTFLGTSAGDVTTTGSNNIIIGYDQDASAADASNELNIGGVIKAYTASPSTVTVYGNFYSTGIVSAANGFVGNGALLTSVPGDNLGNHVATTTLNMNGFAVVTSSNISAARYQIDGSTVVSLLRGNANTGVGINAGMSETGSWDTYLGNGTFANHTAGNYNTGVGANAGIFNLTGEENTFLGANAGYNSTGRGNITIGYNADTSAAAASNELNIGGLFKGYMASPSSAAVYGSFISTGSVGIGTFDIGLNKLSVRGSGHTYSRTITEGSSNEAGMGVQRISPGTPVQSWTWYLPSTLTDIGLYNTAGAKVVMEITQAGLVGLSTALPKSTLSVSGNAAIGATYAGTNAAPANGLIVEGNVGIGTTAPTGKLTVSSGAVTFDGTSSLDIGPINSVGAVNTQLHIHGTDTATAGIGEIKFINRADFGSPEAKITAVRENSNAGVGLNFVVSNDPADVITPVTAMVMKRNGNIGIGTTAPATKLHVNTGTITIDGTGAPTLSYALCLSTAGAMGHCTAAPNANGSCSCVTP